MKHLVQRKLLNKLLILCLGNSLTAGAGAPEGKSYPDVLRKLTGHISINAGESGITSMGILLKLPALLKKYKPDVVVVSIGTNDFQLNFPESQTRENLANIIQTAQFAKAKVVLLPMPDWEKADGKLTLARPHDNLMQLEIGKTMCADVIGNSMSAVLWDSRYRSDNVHGNAAGYKQIAIKVHKGLCEKHIL